MIVGISMKELLCLKLDLKVLVASLVQMRGMDPADRKSVV